MKKSISKIIEQTYEFRTKNFTIRAKVKPDDMRVTEQMTRYNGYEYWLIESALKDEEDLEKFLLENIKIEGKNE